jgi:hypothetical protein
MIYIGAPRPSSEIIRMSFLSFVTSCIITMLMVFLILTAPYIRHYTGTARRKALPCWRWCKVYFGSMLVSERPSTTRSTCSFFFLHCPSSIAYTSTNVGRKLRTNPITFRPHSLLPFLLFLPPSLFLRTLGDATRGTSTPSIQLFFSYFTDIFLYVRQDAYTHSL